MIETIFFDVGGTLLHPDMDWLLQPLLVRCKPTPEQLAEADRASKHSIPPGGALSAPGARTNKGHWQFFFESLLAQLDGCGDLLTELVARAGDSSYWSLLDPAAVETLGRLSHDYRLAVISNADGSIGRVLETAGIREFFAQVTDSGRIGCEKPNPRIFEAALAAMKAEASASLYVGDIYGVDYCGATAAGMQAVLLDPAGFYRDWPAPAIGSLAELPGWIKARLQAETRSEMGLGQPPRRAAFPGVSG